MAANADRTRTSLVALHALACALAISACRGEPPPTDKGDRKSVSEGAKARSAPGRTVEEAKQKVDVVEGRLQERSDEMFDKSAGEKVERGSP